MKQITTPCGRLWDHEPHAWHTNPEKRCPGIIDSGLTADRPAPADDQCECVGYTIRTDYGSGVEHDVDRSSCLIHGGPAPADAPDGDQEGVPTLRPVVHAPVARGSLPVLAGFEPIEDAPGGDRKALVRRLQAVTCSHDATDMEHVCSSCVIVHIEPLLAARLDRERRDVARDALLAAARALPGLDSIRTHGDAARWLRDRAAREEADRG